MEPSRQFVAAIDFGTAYSGYAYASINNLLSDDAKIVTSNWKVGKRTLPSSKAPTCILLNPDQEFDSFGYEAEDKYAKLSGINKNYKGWYFFYRFKMTLYRNNALQHDMELEDINGKTMNALVVFSKCIGYLKDHMYQSIIDTVSDIKPSDIKYVLTVPAAWDESAKRFMREAAVLGGISDDQLVLALEREAASMFCQKTLFEQDEPGLKYLIADLGGGRASIIVYEELEAGKFKEIHCASRVALDGKSADDTFLQFLGKSLGKETMDTFKRLCPSCMEDHIELLNETEITKRDTTDKRIKFNVSMPVVLESIKKKKKPYMDEVVKKSSFSKNVTFLKTQKLQILQNQFRNFYQKTVKSVVDQIAEIIDQVIEGKVNTIVIAGGLSECSLIGLELKKNPVTTNHRVIIPENAGLAVLKGAVLFGYLSMFRDENHPKTKKDKEDSVQECSQQIHISEEKGDSVQDASQQIPSAYEDKEDSVQECSQQIHISEEKGDSVQDASQQIPSAYEGQEDSVQEFSQQIQIAEENIHIKPEEVIKVQQAIQKKYKYDEQGAIAVTPENLEKGLNINEKAKLRFPEVEKDTVELDDKEVDDMVYASKWGEWNVVWEILDKKPYFVNCIPENRAWSALHQAIYNTNLEAVKKLVEEYGADVAIRTKADKQKKAPPGTDALSLAKKLDRKEIYDYLLTYTITMKKARQGQDISYLAIHKHGSIYPFHEYPLFHITLASYKSVFVTGKSYHIHKSQHIEHVMQDVVSYSDATWKDAKVKIRSTLYGIDRGHSEYLLSATNKDDFFGKLIKLYTEDSVYHHLTPALVRHPTSPYKPTAVDLAVGPFALMLSTVLLKWDKLESYDGTTFRGISVNVTNKYHPGETFLFRNFISSSKLEKIAKIFARDGGTMFMFDNSTLTQWRPRIIKRFSKCQWEEECLYPFGAEFKVISRDTKSRKVHLQLLDPCK